MKWIIVTFFALGFAAMIAIMILGRRTRGQDPAWPDRPRLLLAGMALMIAGIAVVLTSGRY